MAASCKKRWWGPKSLALFQWRCSSNVLHFFLTFSQFSQYKKAHNKTSCSWAPQCSQLLWAFQPFRRLEEQNGFLSRKREGYFFMKIGRYRLYFHASAIFSWHCLCIRDNSNKIKLCALMQKGLNSTTYSVQDTSQH